MKNARVLVRLLLPSIVLVAGIVGAQAEKRVRLHVKIDDSGLVRLDVAEGQNAQIDGTEVNLELLPVEVGENLVTLQLTVKNKRSGQVSKPRLGGHYGEEMKGVLDAESDSPITILITPERVH